MSESRSPIFVHAIPPAFPGERVGLFGGTFDPPHAGHLSASRLALARLKLDRLWWLTTPGNPLKRRGDLAPLDRRLAAAARLADDPRIVVTGFEAAFGLTYTLDTVRLLRRRRPAACFVLVLGTDHLAVLHRWRRWRELARLVPIAFVDRPGSGQPELSAPAAIALARGRRDERAAATLPCRKPPAWTVLRGPRVDLSSTALRARGIRP